jgi:hypothetical protein
MARRGRKPNLALIDRNATIAVAYRQGLTLSKIGDEHGLTGERVRQILATQGLTFEDGGRHIIGLAKRRATQDKRDARSLVRWGMLHSEYMALRDGGFVRPYIHQLKTAKNRGIAFTINLAQWHAVWQASGKWDERGRGKGKYCMSRIKDSGGYALGNVLIKTADANSLEAVEKWRDAKPKKSRGVFHLYPGTPKPFMVKVGATYVGVYASEDEANTARFAYAEQNGLTLNRAGQFVRASMRAA